MQPPDWLRRLSIKKGELSETNMATLSVGEPQEMEVDRKGESEESGDDETRRKSINGEVDLNQPPATVKEESPVDMDTITLDPEEEDVDLVHCRIGKIEGLEVLRKAKTLSLRQNLIKNIENLETLVTLKELDLYDNQIRKLENLQTLTELDQLDVSFNLLRKVEGLERLTGLKKLFLLHNKISHIANLDHLTGLEMLELGSNRIRVVLLKGELISQCLLESRLKFACA
ncbi:protein phosphatase 1 regulatory subunit 7 isoform X2 [Oncorhynchus mykiss]|uniref:protein phosphatase 1 regulatory subunit 7 isoform X2 n=1 Tax=Oncorhynchus mykiss TaxID=8022 RepID=UPI001878984F|nr:protein phosphatase 1 regulatory subunit 7 isoform X2 [Oncorhynchus mykiss]